jgi:hypothetical protein
MRKVCSKGCDHRLEDCLCGCEECQLIDAYGDADYNEDDHVGDEND